jgi:hypothetical protein
MKNPSKYFISKSSKMSAIIQFCYIIETSNPFHINYGTVKEAKILGNL